MSIASVTSITHPLLSARGQPSLFHSCLLYGILTATSVCVSQSPESDGRVDGGAVSQSREELLVDTRLVEF